MHDSRCRGGVLTMAEPPLTDHIKHAMARAE